MERKGAEEVHFAPPAQAATRLKLRDLSNWTDFVVVPPGGRLPLAPAPGEASAAVTWRAQAGTVAYAERLAVWQAPLQAGAYQLRAHGLLAGRPVQRVLTAFVSVPLGQVRAGSLNGYPIGHYPRGAHTRQYQTASRAQREDAYRVPAGFIELDHATALTPVSRHYTLADFQGKDTAVGGRKYLFLDPRLVEKLERLVDVLASQGHRAGKIPLMSAYRSPWLNRAIGNVTGLSRHTYGDAVDMIVQDFDRNGRTDGNDARILLAAVTKLDRETDLTGGAAIYPPNGAHGYFVHTDTRGTLVRW
ncbi:MAG: D-Ala-D-Ala carboxypeptidase family metallohydrolase [Candidatus Sericytochromatia bacterium]|nr:D-Ala-D-Ala carboxypeptidase family metallohydrolase [Candidatus Sericytochromatia bacterium]